MIDSPKRLAFQRVAERWKKSQIANDERARRIKLRNHEINQTFKTEGWKHLENGVENAIAELKNQLYNTSSFRFVKCMEIRNEIKALAKLYSSMKTEQAAIILRAARG